MKILIVDDSRVARRIVREEVEKGGHEAVEAENGKEALERIKDHDIDLIILDVEMPVLDGYETCREIRKNEEIEDINEFMPIIFLTSRDTPTERMKGFEAGATNFIVKSSHTGELKVAIDKLLNPEKRWQGLKALVADNTDISRHMTASILKNMGIEVFEAKTGSEAFQIIQPHPKDFDMVITDQDLPEMCGTELCTKIRVELGLKTLPIIFISSEPDRENILNFYKEGATDYLAKPYFKEEFLARLHTHLELQIFYKNLKKNVAYLNQLDSMKDKFLGVCSHDLKTPLNGILGFTDLMLNNPDTYKGNIESLEQIQASGKYLNSLITDLLDVSRMRLTEKEMDMSQIHLEKVIKSSASSFIEMAKTKGITISFKKTESDFLIRGNQMALSRIINNLISNAIKFTSRDGEINIVLKIQDDHFIELSVTDTGVGIPAEKISILFEKFTKASRSGTEGEESHGLGLSIVKELVEKHNGDIRVDSIEGKGTSFKIKLPVLNLD